MRDLATQALRMIDDGPLRNEAPVERRPGAYRGIFIGSLALSWLGLGAAIALGASHPLVGLIWLLPLPAIAWLTAMVVF